MLFMNLITLKEGDTMIEKTKLMVLKVKYRKTKRNDSYTELIVMDENKQEMPAKYWGKKLKVEPGTILHIDAEKDNFNGIDQLILSGYPKVIKEDPHIFIPSYSDDEILAARKVIASGIKDIDNVNVYHIVKYVIKDRIMLFLRSPAALFYHHNKIGGLAIHTAEVFKIAMCLCDVHNVNKVNRDLVKGGALLHDIGKIEEYKTTFKIEPRENGFLLGHCNVGMMYLEAYTRNFEQRTAALHLQHIILSHHGDPNVFEKFHGSIKPQTVAAEIVFLADLASSRGYKAMIDLDSVVL